MPAATIGGMIVWDRIGERLDARYAHQGGPFASVTCEDGEWWVTWWVGPKGRYRAPSEAKARLWVERFATPHMESLGRSAASPGVGPNGKGGYVSPTPEDQARYDAFSASYVPPKRPNRRRR